MTVTIKSGHQKKKKFNVSLWNKKDQSIVTTVIVME